VLKPAEVLTGPQHTTKTVEVCLVGFFCNALITTDYFDSKHILVKAFPYERRPGKGSSSSTEVYFDSKHNLAKAFPYERRPGQGSSSSNELYFDPKHNLAKAFPYERRAGKGS
jgi:hypothetical protein